MFRIDDATAATALPTPEAAGSEGYFTEGNPTAGTPATNVRGSWLNMIQEELRAIVVAGGLTPSKTTYNQVLSAIKRICQNTVILADAGAANAYAAVNATPLVAGTWVDGVVQQIKIAHANTGPSTYAPDGLTAIPIYGLGLQPLQGGELALNGTAVLMHATIAGVNSGNPICVLMECAGGAQQVAPATQPQHAVQLAQLQSSVGSTGAASSRNKLFNSGAQVAIQSTVPTLTTSPQYGPVEMIAAWASGGAITAGTLTQDTAAPVGRTGYAVKLAGCTLTGAGQVSWRYRMEAADAVKFKNQTGTFQIGVQHDVGSAINYTVVFRKPTTTADDFSAVTTIGTSSASSVASATGAVVTATQALGDCSKGLEIEVQVACGAVTTKNFWFTEWQLEEGTVASAVVRKSYPDDLKDCQRYALLIPVGTIHLNGWAGSVGAPIGTTGADYPVEMRVAPSVPSISFSLSQANTPNIVFNTTRSLRLTTTGTVSAGQTTAYNNAAFVITARL
ncbi:hypothetical protein PEP31012_03619 [Pandoraea eparura]|uniref:Tail fiber protein n=1 Tax=Pandoraea eparura TaxID=2508291 RepID=A0A5E4X141_9BURK|nr:hypothetical protein [Pandoraea eparura]VVE30007.1 hypothetical protein PEP31012_03619 [Pandoraea eparura]